jgi:hypothetical protein
VHERRGEQRARNGGGTDGDLDLRCAQAGRHREPHARVRSVVVCGYNFSTPFQILVQFLQNLHVVSA